MKRTISVSVGKGSVNHNSRKFKAENVDGSRTHLNVDYCNERIQTVYHQLFDDALKRYNEKQTRSDRRIPNYYEKIRSGNQEKPFHEIILQIGNKDDMSATGEYAELARTVLDEYYQGFQERNPNLRVFSAHLHMDEATPHLHIDFVPFTTGSKRGLDTRVSLKQALAAQGFKGGTRGATEWVLMNGSDDAGIGLCIPVLLQPNSVCAVAERWTREPDCIVGAAHNGKRGNPCIFPKKFFPELLALTGDTGGSRVIRQHEELLRLVEIPPEELYDCDTKLALDTLKAETGAS